jgi:hypothetical protein
LSVAYKSRELPLALPFLQLLFARDSLVDVAVGLIPDQHFHAIFRRERRAYSGAMLVGAQSKIIRDSDVQRAVALACHHIDGVGALAQTAFSSCARPVCPLGWMPAFAGMTT